MSLSSFAFSIAPFIPSDPGVRTNSAPNAFKRFLLSKLIVSGIVNINLYPFAAETNAKAIPVFPLVGSIITESLFKIPFFSASIIIPYPILSFTLPPGLKYSNLPIIVAKVLFSLL